MEASGGGDGSAFGGSGRQVMKRIKLICGENLCRYREQGGEGEGVERPAGKGWEVGGGRSSAAGVAVVRVSGLLGFQWSPTKVGGAPIVVADRREGG
ncbi:hypothetical protein C2845_PMPSC055583 [Panicum miliaceum]|uniref:Uncharacterized protein n=1 Tax=Panicum miliaceum TaxID=4540 RepID=A0A3L6P9M0_PANMI|nr:hypothetical protein C2845_PMPSC055583 [Panicum miliaceum]